MGDKRISELDLFRGIAILCMIPVHFLYDLQEFGGISLKIPYWVQFLSNKGHLVFILISGICATLGRSPVRRGIKLLGIGFMISYVTLYMDLILGFQNVRIWFGILHLLGFSMVVYPLFRMFSVWELCIFSIFFIIAGLFLQKTPAKIPYFFPLGIYSDQTYPGSDYFPVLPYFGWFLVGVILGKLLYCSRKSRVPGISRENRLVNFLCSAGQNSLIIYLLHQPVLLAITFLAT